MILPEYGHAVRIQNIETILNDGKLFSIKAGNRWVAQKA